jgi:tripartite-type tricarboxylate transporter receptor subunit TctC
MQSDKAKVGGSRRRPILTGGKTMSGAISSSLRYLAFAAALAVVTIAPATGFADGLDPLRDKTVRVLIGGSPNGGTDMYARPMVAALERLLPTSTFYVQNISKVPAVLKEVFGSSGDTIVITVLANGALYSQILEKESMVFDIRDLHWMGAITSNHRIAFAVKQLGATTIDDLRKVDRQLLAVAGSATGANYADTLMVSALTGLDMKVIPDFEEEQRAAVLLAGDADFIFTNYFDVKTLADSGDLVPLFRINDRGYPKQFDSLPVLADVVPANAPKRLVQSMEQLNQMGRLVAAAPHTSEEAAAALRIAFDRAMEDPELQATYAKSELILAPSKGEELGGWIEALLGDVEIGKQIQDIIHCSREVGEGKAESCLP